MLVLMMVRMVRVLRVMRASEIGMGFRDPFFGDVDVFTTVTFPLVLVMRKERGRF